ncbi:hypothetical protein ACOSP7_001607 [Xanthoceras sorbifolium]
MTICYERRRKNKDKGSSTQLPCSSCSGTGHSEDITGLLFVVRKKDKMADSDGSKAGSSVGSSQEKGSRNKRKLADPSQHNPVNLPSSLSELPRYEQTSEQTGTPLSNLQLPEAGSSQSKEDPTVEYQSAEWDDPIVRALAELLSSGLHTLFKDAIKQIVECGFSEDAEKFISRQGIYYGGEDLVTNVVNGALATLKKGKKGIDASSEEVFEDLQQMVDFTMLEMINVLREVKPSLSITEAMWWLLMCDLNISQACTVEGDLSSILDRKEASEDSSSDSTDTLPSDAQSSKTFPTETSEPQISKPPTSHTQSSQPETLKFGSFPKLPKPTNPSAPEELPAGTDRPVSSAEGVEKSIGSLAEQVQTMSLAHSSEERSGTGWKGRGKKGSVALRQKSFHGHTEKSYKHYGKGAFKSRQLANLGGLAVEQRVKPPSESPAVQSKGASSKISTKPGVAASSTDRSQSVSTSTQLAPVSDSSSTPGVVTALPAVSSSSRKNHAPMAEASTSTIPKTPNYYAGIPFDESLGQYVPKDSKDELILKLVPRMHELQNEMNNWTEWANQKVMQAARRLSKDQPELKALRKEKQEAEHCEKEKQILEENAMKRLSEMESALYNATGQVAQSNSVARRLEAEHSVLKKQMEAAKLQAAESAVSYQEALEREQKAVKNTQSVSGQRSLLQEKIETEKQKTAALQRDIGKARNQYNQWEARFNKERTEKEQYLAQAAAIKEKREQLEAAAKAEEDRIKLRAENEKKKYLVDIKKLESQLSLLKYQSDSAKIAALRGSLDGGFGGFMPGSSSSTPPIKEIQILGSSRRGTNLTENAATGGLRQDRECVMCLADEKSVVFLPCAHQVLCPKCNELHEKQGMNDCPSCRTPIQRRINVLFPPPRP